MEDINRGQTQREEALRQRAQILGKISSAASHLCTERGYQVQRIPSSRRIKRERLGTLASVPGGRACGLPMLRNAFYDFGNG